MLLVEILTGTLSKKYLQGEKTRWTDWDKGTHSRTGNREEIPMRKGLKKSSFKKRSKMQRSRRYHTE
jgi:hypothetical protein